jgi:RiboL-PSP-HEPN
MSATGVDRLHDEFSAIIALLDAQSEPSLRTSVDDNFRKSLLLAAASYFESRMVLCVMTFAEEIAGAGGMLTEFIRIKGVERQYHTWFNWKDNNAANFFALFGADFKAFMKAKLKRDSQLESAISSFMEIGRDRNRLVHENFASFSLEKTADDIYAAYKNGLRFVEAMPTLLREGPDSSAILPQAIDPE